MGKTLVEPDFAQMTPVLEQGEMLVYVIEADLRLCPPSKSALAWVTSLNEFNYERRICRKRKI